MTRQDIIDEWQAKCDAADKAPRGYRREWEHVLAAIDAYGTAMSDFAQDADGMDADGEFLFPDPARAEMVLIAAIMRLIAAANGAGS